MICTLANARSSLLGRIAITRNMSKFCNIPQCNSLSLLEVILQSNCKFNEHVRQKLVKANRCLHVLRSPRKKQHTQVEVDHLFKSLVSPNLKYCPPLYVASEPDLNMMIQHFFRSLLQASLCFFSCLH